MDKICFKPLVAFDTKIPTTFEQTIITGNKDFEVQKTPAVWFTRNKKSVLKHDNCLEIGTKHLSYNFRGSIETTVPKGYFTNKNSIELDFEGKGWISIKVMESTITSEGVATLGPPSWKKLDTTREHEIYSSSENRQTKIIKLKNFYNKPFNVAFKAFLKGFKPMNKENITSLEITIRKGCFRLYGIKIQ